MITWNEKNSTSLACCVDSVQCVGICTFGMAAVWVNWGQGGHLFAYPSKGVNIAPWYRLRSETMKHMGETDENTWTKTHVKKVRKSLCCPDLSCFVSVRLLILARDWIYFLTWLENLLTFVILKDLFGLSYPWFFYILFPFSDFVFW